MASTFFRQGLNVTGGLAVFASARPVHFFGAASRGVSNYARHSKMSRTVCVRDNDNHDDDVLAVVGPF